MVRGVLVLYKQFLGRYLAVKGAESEALHIYLASSNTISLYSTISYLIMVVWGIFRVVWGGLG